MKIRTVHLRAWYTDSMCIDKDHITVFVKDILGNKKCFSIWADEIGKNIKFKGQTISIPQLYKELVPLQQVYEQSGDCWYPEQ